MTEKIESIGGQVTRVIVSLVWTVFVYLLIAKVTGTALEMQKSRQDSERECIERFARTCSASHDAYLASSFNDAKARAAYKALAAIRVVEQPNPKEIKQNLTAAVKFYVGRGILPKSDLSLPEQLMAMDSKTVAAVIGSFPGGASATSQRRN